MSHYAPCYDPCPVVGDIEEHREAAFSSDDMVQFLHVGHFVSWYAAFEFGVTMLLHKFTGGPHPIAFHTLTRGMDAKVKIERLKESLGHTGWDYQVGLLKRFEHFTKRIVPIRNQLVHSHLYWPEVGDLQMTSLGRPPIFPDGPISNIPFAKPAMIAGLELYERGCWLNLFGQDVIAIYNSLPEKLSRGGTLGRAQYLSGLPTGDRPSPQKQAQRAKSGKHAQKQG